MDVRLVESLVIKSPEWYSKHQPSMWLVEAMSLAGPLNNEGLIIRAIVHFYYTRDVLPRCQPHDVGEGTTCWPAPELTDNMNTKRVGRLGLSDAEDDAIVSADSDEAGHAFQSEAGHLFRREAGQGSDFIPATVPI
jgi:hypothetical protein